MSKTPARAPQPPVAVAQARPTDIAIPHSIDPIVPEVDLYRRLHDAEKRVDIFTTRKMNDLSDTLVKVPRKKQLLRIFVYNTAENQPWQQPAQQQPTSLIPGQARTSSETPSWTLRVEGRLVNGQDATDPTRRKFSSFISGISVDLIPNDQNQTQLDNGLPPLQPTSIPKENVIEWHENSDPKIKGVEFDGLDVKRTGSENIKARITIQPKEYPVKLRASPDLSRLLGVSETTQHDAVYAIWQYVQLNNLQAAEDKRIINCDENLSKLFGVPRFNFKDVIEFLSKHLLPNRPIELEYLIRVDRATTLGDVVIDIEVPVEDLSVQETWKVESKKLVAEHDEAIKELNTKIILGIQGLHTSHRKYQFYEKLSKDPANFFQEFTESHSKLLKILAGDEGYNEETVRRSEFYTDEMLAENVDILLKTNRM